MSTNDDQPPSDEIPPSESLKKIIHKLDNKFELRDYIHHLSSYHAHHLSDLTLEMRERLMLQGLDEDDLFNLHEFLKVTFEGDLMIVANKSLTKSRITTLDEYLA